MLFATPETIKQPKGGLILQDLVEADYVLGANDPKKLGHQVLVEDGHWEKFLPIQEIQRVRDGDTYCCVTYSKNNASEMVHKRKYGYEINISDMFVGVASGTQRGVGNSIKGVSEWVRKNGFVYESDYPYSRSMSLDEFYTWPPASLFAKAKEMLNIYETSYMALGGVGQSSLLEGLSYSPIQVAIEGQYVFDASGKIRNGGGAYSHAVIIFDYVADANGGVDEWWVFDSETEQFLRFRGDYQFMSPYIHFIEKKNMKMYKKIGEPAIYVKHWSENLLIPFASGAIPGGDLFKSLYGIEKYSELPREDVTELPFPVAEYGITTAGLKPFGVE